MELESHYFNDLIFKFTRKDFQIIRRSYFERGATVEGWYKDEVEDLIKKEPKKYKYILQQNGFMDEEGTINWPTYNLNWLGFRSDDWRSGKDGVIFLGCSDTFGVGNYFENTASSIVSKKLGVQNYNLAIPGAGFDQAYRVLKANISDIPGKVVCLIAPEPNRREIFSESKSVLLSPSSWRNGSTKQHVEDFYDINSLQEFYFKLMCEKKYTFIQTQKNIDAIKYLCKEYGKHLVILKNPIVYGDKSSRDIYKECSKGVHGKIDDFACDLHHAGPNYQKLVAKNLLKKL